MKNVNFTIDFINLLEYQIKKLDILKFELKNNKPFWFQKQKMEIYNENIKIFDKKIKFFNSILLEEYIKLEQTKK